MTSNKLEDLNNAIKEVEELKWTIDEVNWFEKSENYWSKLKWLQRSMKNYVDDILWL